MLSRWLHNRRRKIFRYYDGRKVRGADPIEISIGLAEHPTYLPGDLEDARWGNQEALEKVATAACDVFGVKPLAVDGKSGMTVSERLELMLAFDLYLLALKKHRHFADTAVVFGVDSGKLERSDYERYVGLWTNRVRATIRTAEQTRLGIVAATRPPQYGWCLATHDTADEAQVAYDRAMAAHAESGGD